MNIIFLEPKNLFFLFFIPLMILIHFISVRLSKRKAIKFANFDAIAKIKGIDLYSKNVVVLILSCIVMILMSLTLAHPSLTIEKKVSQSSFVIAMDSSRSMEANDILPSRLEAAKKTAKSFVDSVPLGTRLGVISFSGNSIIEQKLTDDKSLVKESIDNLEITNIGGTDTYEAVITGVNLLVNEDAKSIILLSDGQINVGSTGLAIDYAKENNVIVNTIAIGTENGGNTSYGFSRLDEDSLKALSYNTQGNFSRAGDEKALERSFISIVDAKMGIVSIDISKYLLIASIAVFILLYLLVNTKFRSFP